MIIATVLLATAISVTATKRPTPILALFFPIIIFWIWSINHCIPPAFVAIAANPPVRSERRNISFIPRKPLYISFVKESKVKFPKANPIIPERNIPQVRTIKTFTPTIARIRTTRYGTTFKKLYVRTSIWGIWSGFPNIKSKITVIIAAGAAIYKFTLNLSLISTPWVFVAAIVVSDITERLSPNIAPPITAAKIKGRGTPLFSASPTAIGVIETIAPTEVPVAVDIKDAIINNPAAI